MNGNRRIGARRLGRRSFVLFGILLLYGCPYTSNEPLSEPSSAVVDPALIGAWRTRDGETGEWQRLVFARFNEHETVSCARDDASGEVSLSRTFLTEIGGERFLNIRELGADDEPWYVALCVLEGDRCTLRFIDDGLFDSRTFGSTEERRQFIRAHLADPLLYAAAGDTPMVMVLERVRSTD
jgi:hypothetical protein